MKEKNKGKQEKDKLKYRDCEIEVSGTSEAPLVQVNGNPVEIQGCDVAGKRVWRSPLDYNYFETPQRAAQGLIELQRAMTKPTLDFIDRP